MAVQSPTQCGVVLLPGADADTGASPPLVQRVQASGALNLPLCCVCRFTDSEQQRLFQSIQLYVTMFSSSNPEPDSPALGLVEDALKMPFTGESGHPVSCF